jgi:hypothetical protein
MARTWATNARSHGHELIVIFDGPPRPVVVKTKTGLRE